MSEKVGKIEIVIKGGQPWGFRLQAKAENRSVVIVDEIVRGGRADQQGKLKVGDHVIKINGIQCLSLADALQLIESAFRTLTIVVWRTNNFLTKDKPKDYFDSVHQFDQLSNNPPYQSHNSSPSEPIYENINFTFQEGKQRSRRISPIEKAYHINNKDILATNSQQLSCYNGKMYLGRNDSYRNNFKVPYSNLDKTYKSEPEKKTEHIHNPDRKFHSKTQRDFHHYSNVQQLTAVNYTPEINKYDGRHFSRIQKEMKQYSSVHSFSNSTYGKTFKISDSPNPAPVPSIPVQGKNMLTINHNLGQYPVSNRLINAKVSSESDCCRYPNCHNKYFNCKIHSPPERDVTYPVRESFSNDYENIDFFSQPNYMYKDQNSCDSLNYEQSSETPTLSPVPPPLPKKNKVPYSKTLKGEKVYVPSNRCDYPVINSPIKPSNYKLESINYIVPKTTSDIHVTKSMNENSVSSLCHFSNSVYEEKHNSQTKVGESNHSVKDSNVFHYKTVYGQIKHMSYNMQGKESSTECVYSSNSKPSFNKRMFSSVNNASFIKENDMFFGASNNSMCMISKEAAVVKLVSSRPQQIYTQEDAELKEIDENKNKTAIGLSSISMSPPPPSPPPEGDTEILPCNEPLPSPPLFVSEQKQNNGNEMVETIYANLEMLKIQYSVVSSQTSSSNEKHVENISDHVSSAANTSDSDPSGFAETTSQVVAPLMENVLQNQEGQNLRVLNLPFNSAYFTTSVPKAKLLTRYTSKLHSTNMPEVKELSNEKEELITSLRKKLDILLEEEAAVQDELQQNEELGKNLSDKLESLATQNEFKKFSNHVQELEKITNLLLSLSGRSARTKNALLILPSNAPAEEKMLLETKYKKLTQQYEEALQLQNNIDNRNKQVLLYLQKYFTKDELADYNHFIKMKVKLLVDYKELVEKIKLGEEQLKALTDS